MSAVLVEETLQGRVPFIFCQFWALFNWTPSLFFHLEITLNIFHLYEDWFPLESVLFWMMSTSFLWLLPLFFLFLFLKINPVDTISSQSYLLSFWTYHSEEAHILSILDVKSRNTGQILNKPYKCTHHPFNTNKIWYCHFFPNYLFLHTPLWQELPYFHPDLCHYIKIRSRIFTNIQPPTFQSFVYFFKL